MLERVSHGRLKEKAARLAIINIVGNIHFAVILIFLNEKVGTVLTNSPPTPNKTIDTTQGCLKKLSDNWNDSIIGKSTNPAPAGAGTPEKKCIRHAGASLSSNATLNRANRRPQHIENNIEMIHPERPKSCIVHKYKIIAGATPKQTKSDKESNSAPNLLEPFNSLATRPSKVSKIAAATSFEL